MGIGKPARFTVTAIRQISRIANVIAVVFLAVMMLLTVTDVILRYFFSKPIMGSMELTEYFMVIAGFLGIAYCGLKKKHLKVDLIVSSFSPRTQGIFDIITYILALTVVPLVVWQNVVQALYARADNVVSDLLEWPAYPFYIAIVITFGLLFVVLLNLLVDSIIKVVRDES